MITAISPKARKQEPPVAVGRQRPLRSIPCEPHQTHWQHPGRSVIRKRNRRSESGHFRGRCSSAL